VPPREQMRVAAERLAEEIQASEREGRRRSWRKVTTLLAAFGVRRLTSEVRAEMSLALREAGLVCEPSFDSVERSDTVRLSMAALEPPTPPPGRSTADESRAEKSFSAGKITVWRPGERPRALSDDSVNSPHAGDFLVIDVDPNAEPTERLHEALVTYCGGALTVELVEDLLKADPVPTISVDHGGLRLFSTFGVLPTDELTADEEAVSASTAGKLVFQPVEMIVGQDWLITCWHNSQHHAPNGPVGEGQPILRDTTMRRVQDAWASQSLRSPDDLALLITTEMAESFDHAVALLTAWQEQWEVILARGSVPETETLLSMRRHLAEYRSRLQGLIVTKHGFHGQPRFSRLTDPELEQQLDHKVERALESLVSVTRQVRSGIESVNMLRLAEQQTQSGKFQDRLTLLGAILLGPALVATVFGANVELPGRDQVLGTLIMLGGMVIVVVLSVLILRRLTTPQGGQPPTPD
jgi:Mg2+ and Co2+ transporter CorA